MCLIADMETIPQMKSAGTPEKSRLPALLGAGDERIELPLRVLETPVIPFDQSPILNCVFITVAIIHIKYTIVKG